MKSVLWHCRWHWVWYTCSVQSIKGLFYDNDKLTVIYSASYTAICHINDGHDISIQVELFYYVTNWSKVIWKARNQYRCEKKPGLPGTTVNYSVNDHYWTSFFWHACVFRPGRHCSVGYVCSWSGETLSSLYPVSTPSARHAGSSTALYLSKMAWELVSVHAHTHWAHKDSVQ